IFIDLLEMVSYNSILKLFLFLFPMFWIDIGYDRNDAYRYDQDDTLWCRYI
ncbi:unnamed protein product, partial [Rotaria magnacalcarata]